MAARICINQSSTGLTAPKNGCLSPPGLCSSSHSLIWPLSLRELHTARPSQEWANGGGFLSGKGLPGKCTPRKHAAHPTPAPSRKRGQCKAVLAAPAQTTTRARPETSPVETVLLNVITGTEGDAGMFGIAKVTFIPRDRQRFPDYGPLVIPGPFAHSTQKPPIECKLPVDFEVAGIIVENPKDFRLDIRVLAWLADRLNVKIPVVNENLLDLLTSIPIFKRLTNGDWYIDQLELSGGSPGGEKQVFPLYGWVQEASVRLAFNGKAYLPQDTPPGVTPLRRKALIVNQNAYNFQPYNDLSKPPNNDNYLSPDFRPTLDPYPQHVQAPRTGPDAGSIPRDENFGLSKSVSFTRGAVRGFVNLAWALVTNWGTGRVIARDVAVGVAAGFLTGNLAEQYLTEDVLDEAGKLVDGLLPSGVQNVVWFVFGNVPAGTVVGGLVGLATGIGLLVYDVPKLSFKSVKGYVQSCFGTRLGKWVGYQKPWLYTVGKEQPDKAWNTDFMFGWQTIAGINPETIALVTSERKLSEGGTITKEDLKKVEKELPSFHNDLKNKRIFMLDYSAFEEFMPRFNNGAGKKAGKHLYAPVVLLRQTDNENHGVPVPIAVKLSKDEKDIITPGSDTSEGKWGWTLAKAIAASGNSGVHQLVQHWLRCHAVSETYGLAVRRQLSEVHPLFKLLIPHTRYTMDINNLARSFLINTDGIIERTFSPGAEAMQVSAAIYRGWRFEHEHPEADLKARGVFEESVLPNYPYREHSLEVWAAIKEYVTEYVELYYGGDEDIADDYELQAFWADIKQAHRSLDTWLKIPPENSPAGSKPGPGLVWPPLKSKADLVLILATIIYTGSAMHSLVNFGQYDYSAFVLNSPASIRGEFDYAKLHGGAYTESDFMAAMPTAVEMMLVMTVVETLVAHSQDEQYLGQQSEPAKPGVYPPLLTADPWLVDGEAGQVYDRFVTRISKAQEKLVGLNTTAEETGSLPYYYLLPRKKEPDWEHNIPAQGVPNSVTI